MSSFFKDLFVRDPESEGGRDPAEGEAGCRREPDPGSRPGLGLQVGPAWSPGPHAVNAEGIEIQAMM